MRKRETIVAGGTIGSAGYPVGAEVLVAELVLRGVERIYGVPGGECSLDVIEAGRQRGIEFVLARNESCAAIMAAVDAELSGSLGVVLTTRGPGLANAANGIAYAALDRAPLLLIADGWEDDEAYISYQRFDQMALLQPLTKGFLRLNAPAALPALGSLLDLALSEPGGPVYLEVTGSGMRGPVPPESMPLRSSPATMAPHSPETIEKARALVAAASRPVVIAGMQATGLRTTSALRELAAQWKCPVFTTYRAKGVLPDADPLLIGHYIGGPVEEALLREADLVVLVGADPIEFAPKPWTCPAPILALVTHTFARNYFEPALSLVGDLADAAAGIRSARRPGGWNPDVLARAKAQVRERARAHQGAGISPQMVIDAARAAMPPGAVVTVDSGAHMLPAMALCEARQPREVLISKGLATMAFALPAAIGAALASPARRVVAFTGDGGLMMCAGELATAVQYRCNLTVVVLNDSSASLIGVKQRRRQLPQAGVDYSPTDFSIVARGFGCRAFRVDRADALAGALREAMQGDGPALVDVVVDPSSYDAHVRALRG